MSCINCSILDKFSSSVLFFLFLWRLIQFLVSVFFVFSFNCGRNFSDDLQKTRFHSLNGIFDFISNDYRNLFFFFFIGMPIFLFISFSISNSSIVVHNLILSILLARTEIKAMESHFLQTKHYVLSLGQVLCVFAIRMYRKNGENFTARL